MTRRRVRPRPDAELRRASRTLGAQAAALLLAILALFAAIVVVQVVRGQNAQTVDVLDEAVAAAHGGRPDRPDGDDARIRSVSVAVSDDHHFAVDGAMPAGLPDRAVMDTVARTGVTDQRTVELDGRHYAVRTVRTGDDTVQAVLDLSEDRSELGRLVQAMIVAGLAGIVVVAAASAWLGGRVVAPLVEALGMQRRFVSDAAHELRTPLTLLSTRAQLLARRIRAGDGRAGVARPAELADLDGLVQDAANLTAILEELLLSADVRAAPAEDVDLAATAATAVAAATGQAQQAGVRLRVVSEPASPLVVRASRAALLRALTALIDNAVDHAESAVEVEVRAGRAGRRGPGPRVVVSDDGPGIRADQLDQIFDRFGGERRGETGPRRHYGLGLSLVSEIVARYGGSVRADNRPGGGAVFTVTLPPAARPPRSGPGARA
ncbi:signal transduction histidine kinase [Friedmanniella endophytica]|uniref:histidine kinase n=1 Tax=Microlunatus kandeliicorticis TaxID=1759536 RepID=A0A7W3P7A6_9ACTN|nr:HAMP domain-containing sensor histidine kinase [Microlunatus kandeliicorticis]MBA8795931.1 signal transduction histidine kinase [Microlunatus kandeliicorticis]